MNHTLDGLMDSAMSNIKAMVDVDTVIGNAIKCDDGTVIIPISSVYFGFGAGGSDFSPKEGSAITEKMFGGGCGGGANVKPTGFLVVTNGNVRYIPVSGNTNALDKLVDLMPSMFDKLNGAISGFKSRKEKKPEQTDKIEIID